MTIGQATDYGGINARMANAANPSGMYDNISGMWSALGKIAGMGAKLLHYKAMYDAAPASQKKAVMESIKDDIKLGGLGADIMTGIVNLIRDNKINSQTIKQNMFSTGSQAASTAGTTGTSALTTANKDTTTDETQAKQVPAEYNGTVGKNVDHVIGD